MQLSLSTNDDILKRKKYIDLISGDKKQILTTPHLIDKQSVKHISDECGKSDFYVYYNIPHKVCSIYADYICKGLKYKFSDKKIQDSLTNKEEYIYQKIWDIIYHTLAVGYTPVEATMFNGEPQIFQYNIVNYFPDLSTIPLGGDHNHIRNWAYISTINIGTENNKVIESNVCLYQIGQNIYGDGDGQSIYIQNFKMKGDARIALKITKDNIYDYKIDKQIQNSGFILSNNITSIVGSSDCIANEVFFGKSEISNILDLLSDITMTLSYIKQDIHKHSLPKMSISQAFISQIENRARLLFDQQKDPSGYYSYIDNILSTAEWYISGGYKDNQTDTGETKYIQRDVSYLKENRQIIHDIISLISTMTDIPATLLGNDDLSGNIKVGTINKQYEPFYNKVESKRKYFSNNIANIVAYLGFIASGKYEVPNITFSKLQNPISENPDPYITLAQDGKLSAKTLIKSLLDIDDEAYDQELQQIIDETNRNNLITGQ